MKTTLQDITTIQTGLFAKTVIKGDIVYLQAKHFDENAKLMYELHPDLTTDSSTEKHLLNNGDILFAAKGTRNFAAVYESHNLPAVASTTFFVIRLKETSILPEFLAWYLNHPDTQKFLKTFARGSAMVSISKAVLEKIEISIPSIEKQKLIIKIDGLKKEQLSIQKKLIDLQLLYIQNVLIKSIQ